jgi:hypothetical protein
MRPSDRQSRDVGPPPNVDQEVALEGLFATVLTTIVEKVSDGLITVSPPRVAGVEVPLDVRLGFTLSYRVRGVRCEAPCMIVGRPSSDENSYVLELTGLPRRVQRRGDVRVPAQLEVTLLRIQGRGEPSPPILASTVDVSLGGMQLTCDTELRPGEEVGAAIACEDLGTLNIRLEVVRCSRDAQAHLWRIGARISAIEPAERRRLSTYLLDRQRLLRRRELGLD